MRYLFGAILDWPFLLKEAYRVNKPGAWVQSCECDVKFVSDDGTAEADPVLKTWAQLYEDAGKKMGRSFEVVKSDLQRKALEEAGYEDIQVVNYKVCGTFLSPKLQVLINRANSFPSETGLAIDSWPK